MQNQSDTSFRHQESNPETSETLTPQETLITPEMQTTPNRYWEVPHWQHYMPPTPDPFVWPTTPVASQNMFNFNVRPMVASAPVTPDVVPYHDPNFPYYYNYHVDSYNVCNQWSQGDYQVPQNIQVQDTPEKSSEDVKPQITHMSDNTQQYPRQEVSYEPTVAQERLTLCTTLTPPNPPVEMYSPMIPLHPGTPVIYAPPPEMTEMMVPTTPMTVYNPPVDMQYVSPGPYIYPPTPPTAWYPPGINSQGFIFPQPINTQGIPK